MKNIFFEHSEGGSELIFEFYAQQLQSNCTLK
jgi:hypothetical protein